MSFIPCQIIPQVSISLYRTRIKRYPVMTYMKIDYKSLKSLWRIFEPSWCWYLCKCFSPNDAISSELLTSTCHSATPESSWAFQSEWWKGKIEKRKVRKSSNYYYNCEKFMDTDKIMFGNFYMSVDRIQYIGLRFQARKLN